MHLVSHALVQRVRGTAEEVGARAIVVSADVLAEALAGKMITDIHRGDEDQLTKTGRLTTRRRVVKSRSSRQDALETDTSLFGYGSPCPRVVRAVRGFLFCCGLFNAVELSMVSLS